MHASYTDARADDASPPDESARTPSSETSGHQL